MDLPNNFEKCENEYFMHHDPYCDDDDNKCVECGESCEKDFCSTSCYHTAMENEKFDSRDK